MLRILKIAAFTLAFSVFYTNNSFAIDLEKALKNTVIESATTNNTSGNTASNIIKSQNNASSLSSLVNIDSNMIKDIISKEIKAIFDKELKPITDKVTGQINSYVTEYTAKIERVNAIVNDFEKDLKNIQNIKNNALYQINQAANYAKKAGIIIGSIIGIFVFVTLTLLILLHIKVAKLQKVISAQNARNAVSLD